jgi:type I restriction enzyme M protein
LKWKNLAIHPQRGKRPLTKKDFEEQNAMFLPEKAQFDYLVSLPESADIGEAIDNAMKLIEDEYENLKGVLPKNFSIFSKDLLRELLRIFNKEVLQKAEGDLFGKIYEYFLKICNDRSTGRRRVFYTHEFGANHCECH